MGAIGQLDLDPVRQHKEEAVGGATPAKSVPIDKAIIGIAELVVGD